MLPLRGVIVWAQLRRATRGVRGALVHREVVDALPEYLSQSEAATACGVSPTTIRNARQNGRLPGSERGPKGGWRIPVSALVAAGFLTPSDTGATPPKATEDTSEGAGGAPQSAPQSAPRGAPQLTSTDATSEPSRGAGGAPPGAPLSAPPSQVEALRRELETTRERLREAEQRAHTAEALADERGRALEVERAMILMITGHVRPPTEQPPAPGQRPAPEPASERPASDEGPAPASRPRKGWRAWFGR